jgi:hypothetical protein
MAYSDEFGTVWERKVTHIGPALKLACPGQGRVVSVLFRTSCDTIRYSIPGTGISQHPWPPDTSANYGERCPCGECLGRLVGASVDGLTAQVILLIDVTRAHEDTYFLGYLESARSAIEPEAAGRGYQKRRDSSSGTDTYERPNRKVIVGYDEYGEVEHVRVQSEAASYPRTLRGALDAIAGSS